MEQKKWPELRSWELRMLMMMMVMMKLLSVFQMTRRQMMKMTMMLTPIVKWRMGQKIAMLQMARTRLCCAHPVSERSC